jgi:hypothetical protein
MVPIPDPKTDKKFQPGLKRQQIEFTYLFPIIGSLYCFGTMFAKG